MNEELKKSPPTQKSVRYPWSHTHLVDYDALGGAPHRQSVVTGPSGGKSGAAQKGEQWGRVTGVNGAATDSQQPGSSCSL